MRKNGMSHYGRWISMLLLAATMTACSDSKNETPAAAPAQAAPQPQSKRVIDQLFDTEVIGMNFAYVEKIAGPAMRSEFHRHAFRTDGCDLTLVTDDADKVVNSVEVSITPSCNLSLEPIFGPADNSPAPKLGDLSFGRFEESLGGSYYADCLTMCGNATDPTLYLQAEGSRAMNFMEFSIQAPIADNKIIEATDVWEAAMRKAESEDYVLDTRFNCEPQRFRDAISAGVKDSMPTIFSFGHGLGFEQGECK